MLLEWCTRQAEFKHVIHWHFTCRVLLKIVKSDLRYLEGFSDLMKYKQSMLNMPSHNVVSGLCLGRRQGRFIGVLIQQVIIEHLVMTGIFFIIVGCSLMGEKPLATY